MCGPLIAVAFIIWALGLTLKSVVIIIMAFIGIKELIAVLVKPAEVSGLGKRQ